MNLGKINKFMPFVMKGIGLPGAYLAFFVGWWAKLVNNEDSLQNKIGLENPDATGRSQFPGRAYDFDGTNNLSKTFASGTVQALIIRINKAADTELLQLATGDSIAITAGALAITGETGTVYVDKVNTTTVGSDAEYHIAINFDNPISLGDFLFGKVGATFGDFSARDLRLFASVLTTQEISDAFDEEPLGDELAWWFCEDTDLVTGFDASGNGYHLTKVSWDSANHVEGTWQSLMNKYGYNIAIGGPSLMDAGKGTFDSGTESWVAQGNNTIENDNGALKVTYVDNSTGAKTYLRNTDDLSTDLTIGKSYRVRIRAKVNTGTVTIRVYTSVLVATNINNTDFEWFDFDITASSVNGHYIQFAGMSAGEAIWIDEWSIQEWYDTVVLPDMSTAINGIPSLDALGNTLIHRGQVKYNPAYKKSACALGDGVMYMTITGLLTTDVITVESGSDTPTCTVNGRLDIANEDEVYGVTIKRGGVLWAYLPMCEPSGTTFHDVSGNGNHATIISGDETNFSEQNLFHYLQNYGYSRKGASLMDPNQPLHIPDTCKVWLDGKDASKFSLNGTKVIQWNDKGELGAHISCSVDAQRPTYDPATGRVTFTSANSTFLQSAAFGSALSQPNTIFIVYKITGALNETEVVFDGLTVTNRNVFLTVASKFRFDAGLSIIDGDTDANDNIHCGLFNGVSSKYWINGVLKISADVGAKSLGGITLGASYPIADYMDCQIMEVIVYNADISDVSREKIEAYLAKKWDIPGLLIVPALSDKTTDALGNALTHPQNNIRLLEETTLQMPEKIHELIQADKSDKLYNIVTDVPEFVKMEDLNVIMGEFYIKKEVAKKWSNDLILIKEGKILTDAENAKLLNYIDYDLSKWMETRAGSEAVTTAGTVIALSSAILYKSYAALIRCFDGSGNNIDFGFIDKVNDGFKIMSAINGTVEHINILNLDQTLDLRTISNKPVIAGGTPINFPELPSTDYAILIRCFYNTGDNADFKVTNKTGAGFILTPTIVAPFVNAYIDCILVIDETTNRRVGFDIAVTTAGTPITFSSDMATINYATKIRCFNALGENIDFGFTNKAVSGFTITPANNGFIDFVSIINE